MLSAQNNFYAIVAFPDPVIYIMTTDLWPPHLCSLSGPCWLVDTHQVSGVTSDISFFPEQSLVHSFQVYC